MDGSGEHYAKWNKPGSEGQIPYGMQTGAATVENTMEFPQKTKNGIVFSPSNSAAGSYPKNPETPIQKNVCTPMFITAQFTVAKYWKQPKCPSSKWVDPKTVVYLHNGILRSREKEGAPTLCDSMDGTGEHYAKWNKPGSEGQIPYDLTFLIFLFHNNNKNYFLLLRS